PVWSGVLLGLAISANLSAAFPALALICAASAIQGPNMSRLLSTFAKLSLPAAAVFAAICSMTMRLAGPQYFFTGAHRFGESIHNLVTGSLWISTRTSGPIPGGAVSWIERVILPVIVLIAVAALRFVKDRKLWLPIATLTIALIGIVVAHAWLNVLYPAD